MDTEKAGICVIRKGLFAFVGLWSIHEKVRLEWPMNVISYYIYEMLFLTYESSDRIERERKWTRLEWDWARSWEEDAIYVHQQNEKVGWELGLYIHYTIAPMQTHDERGLHSSFMCVYFGCTVTSLKEICIFDLCSNAFFFKFKKIKIFLHGRALLLKKYCKNKQIVTRSYNILHSMFF